jgi:hypothetical protein
MYEFSLNKLAGMLDVDRATLLRALKDTPADAGSERKPLFRVSTAIKALDHHRGKPDRRRKPDNGGGEVTLDLATRFAKLDQLRERVEQAPTIREARRIMRTEFFPTLAETNRAMREHAEMVGEDGRLTGLRVAEHERIQIVTLREPCRWNVEQMLEEFNAVTAPAEIDD